MQNGPAIFETIGQAFVKLNIHLLYDPEILLLYLPKRNENVCPQEDMYTNAHSGIIYESAKLEAICMFMTWWQINKL